MRDYKDFWDYKKDDFLDLIGIKLKLKEFKEAVKQEENKDLFAIKVTQAKYELVKELFKKYKSVERIETVGCPFCSLLNLNGGINPLCDGCVWLKFKGKTCDEFHELVDYHLFTRRDINLLNGHLRRLKNFEKKALQKGGLNEKF